MKTYSDQEVFEKIRSIMVELFEIPEEKITLSSRLYEDLELDSIDAVDMIVKLQEFVGKRVQPEQFKSVRTLHDVVAASQKLLSEDQPA
jgi:acyl carrier protein